VESNQINTLSLAVFGHAEQIGHALEARFTSQIVRDVLERNLLHRVHDDMSVVDGVLPADLYMRTHPDTHAATTSSAANAFSQSLREDHRFGA